MSRRSTLPQQHPRTLVHSTVDNPYQTTTENFTRSHNRASSHRPRDPYHAPPCNYHCAKHSCNSDTDTNTYYEYYSDDIFQPSPTKKELRSNVEYVFSDDSGSTRLPHYEELSLKRHARTASYDRKTQQVSVKNGKVLNSVLVHKDVRRVYPNQEESDRLYHEVLDPRSSSESSHPRRELPRSRLSDRPQSSQSSGVGSAIVDGCGGRCQTFENVCYYFLQVAFTMGVLIGTSLCIAGAVLRKSAARNLQVLVYIGAMLSLVSALLLGVQCSARHAARKRKKALRNAKRAPIPLDTLNRAPAPAVHQAFVEQLPMQRVSLNQQYPQRQMVVTQNPMAEDQGIPWWRRKDPT